MRRLTGWFKRFFGAGDPESPGEQLPFTPEEFARLIQSGRSEDMKRLADGFSLHAVSRIAAAERASPILPN